MEFSFDPSKDSHLRSATQQSATESRTTPETPKAPNQATSSSSTSVSAADDGIDTSTIANERLRKAIERNRARQAERNKNVPPNRSASEQPIASPQATLFDKSEENIAEEQQMDPPKRPKAQERTASMPPRLSAAVVTRKSVARPDEADFAPVKRAPRKVASQISYTTTSSRKKSKNIDPTLVGYFVKGCWIFCALMILRLLFASGGVTDYYSHLSVYENRLQELERIKKENMQLVHEIERMRSDVAFQKKLVRDNLGFIASDEFLVLFPKEKSVQ